jgi:antitoxin component YwqK of YwqJK toxin-antitoxin module
MKKLIILICLFLVSLSQAQDQEYFLTEKTNPIPFERYWDNGNLQQSGYVTVLTFVSADGCTATYHSVCDSIWRMYNSQGELMSQNQFCLGTKCGVWSLYEDDLIYQMVYDERGIKVRLIVMTKEGRLVKLTDFE